MKLLDLIGLNPIKPLIAYGGDGGGGGGGGGDDDRYVDPYEEMARNPQNYAPDYGGDGPEYGPPVAQTPVVVPEVYVPPAVVTPPTPTVRPQLRPTVMDAPTTDYQGNNLGGGGGDDGRNNLVGTPVGFSTGGSTAPVTATGEKIGALPSVTSGTSGNSFRETLANMFTPFDGASYQNGRLVDDRTGDLIKAGGETFSGRTIRGSFNDTTNDENEVPPSFYEGLSLPVTNPYATNNPNQFVDPDTGKISYKNRYDPSQLDDKWGYTRPDGTVVTAAQDKMDGGGKNFGGEVFGISGGINADLNGDGYITKAEAQASGGLNENFVSSLSNASGATPLGSGLDPTGLAAVLNTPVIGGALTGGLSSLYTGARYLTDNFGYEGRPESSKNQSMEDILSGLEGQNRENAQLNATMAAAQAAAQSSQNTTGGTSTGGGGGGNQGDGDNRSYLGGPNSGSARSIYNRYYKGGGGRFLPPWLQKYASGVNIDELLTKQVIDGVEYYITPEGRQIEAQYLTGAAVGAEQDI
jgi:hypothetical protein